MKNRRSGRGQQLIGPPVWFLEACPAHDTKECRICLQRRIALGVRILDPAATGRTPDMVESLRYADLDLATLPIECVVERVRATRAVIDRWPGKSDKRVARDLQRRARVVVESWPRRQS